MGIEVAKQCKSVGVNLNFAPVADVNNNAANPVINSRSFGENPDIVAQKASMYMKGMQSQDLLTCAKHFPGHGDTDSDSHKTLPTVNASRHDLDSIHFKPFKKLISENVASIMVAHLYIPAIDSTENRASTLSPLVVDSLLKRQFNFKGLAITDALEMKGVSNYFAPGELEVMALKAGNDILLMPHDAQTSVDSIYASLQNGVLDSNDIYSRVQKVLKYKYRAKLNTRTNISKDNTYSVLNNAEAMALKKQLYRNAITLVQNPDSLIPATTNLKVKTAVVSVGVNKKNAFSNTVLKYRNADLYSIRRNSSIADIQKLANKLKAYDIVILTILNTNNSTSKNYGIYSSSYDLANLISQNSKLIIDIHANPYAADRFINSGNNASILISYQEDEASQEAAAEAIFGGSDITGKLPVSINDTVRQGFGIDIKKKRLSFGLPEEIGISSDSTLKIDSIIQSGIDKEAYPGCQVLVAKDGFVFYQKNFGHQTYDVNSPIITDTTIYDLASITKVMSTTLSIMKLVDEGKIDIDQRLKYYFPELDSTNKGDILIRDLLAHQARLTPWIPFYLHSMKDQKLDTALYKNHKEDGYSTMVTPDIYILDSYVDSIMEEIKESDLLKKKKYRYSDLGMYYMRRLVEKKSGESIYTFVEDNFYSPLGLKYIGFNPLERFPKKEMAPTEHDTYFRDEIIQGTVHDPGCAMVGGIEGHAGLFSNSLNLAVLSQMLLQKGNYCDSNYINSKTISEFTRQQFPLNDNRRGLGFDKSLPNHEEGGPTCPEVSSNSFGHSGFTGTLFWIDPDNGIVYIFLSNRTFPTAENRKLITMNIRTEIQKEIYSLFGIKVPKKNN
jgi:beta-glucosidase-like glycosyl hydrolase/CubicO group peptidase (beta-lactamase class C family)